MGPKCVKSGGIVQFMKNISPVSFNVPARVEITNHLKFPIVLEHRCNKSINCEGWVNIKQLLTGVEQDMRNY